MYMLYLYTAPFSSIPKTEKLRLVFGGAGASEVQDLPTNAEP